ncbi:putative phosphohydrolase, DHH superfamily [Thermogladius calderae 1633]|uniref:Putative phosphohydrolase, DHH superfamily n=1 Tax=Thermogladius calderae (strain DSM 22663 / VKM B-2946 / 1633) TaxID=1184251 RepID=I3TFH9_THEC1|nr:putative phosphohydrolase, DHH superfamily [Thermogladius calderae 1633]
MLSRVSITHWDIDGLASAAFIYFKVRPVQQILASVTSLPNYLLEVLRQTPPVREVWIADLNPQVSSLKALITFLEEAKKRRIRVYWLDHHEWDPGVYRELVGFDDVLTYVVDPNYTAADLVASKLGLRGDKFVEELLKLSYDDDFFLNKYELTVRWRRVLRWYGWEVRYKALESFKRRDLAPAWMIELYNREVSVVYENLIREAIARMDIVERDGFRIMVFPDVDPRVHPGEIVDVSEKNGLIAHLYIVRYPRGVSLRSDYIDVSSIARDLGGGGHARAAGIPGEVSLRAVLNKVFEKIDQSKYVPLTKSQVV